MEEVYFLRMIVEILIQPSVGGWTCLSNFKGRDSQSSLAYEFGRNIWLVEAKDIDSHLTKHGRLDGKSDLLRLKAEILTHPNVGAS